MASRAVQRQSSGSGGQGRGSQRRPPSPSPLPARCRPCQVRQAAGTRQRGRRRTARTARPAGATPARFSRTRKAVTAALPRAAAELPQGSSKAVTPPWRRHHAAAPCSGPTCNGVSRVTGGSGRGGGEGGSGLAGVKNAAGVGGSAGGVAAGGARKAVAVDGSSPRRRSGTSASSVWAALTSAVATSAVVTWAAGEQRGVAAAGLAEDSLHWPWPPRRRLALHLATRSHAAATTRATPTAPGAQHGAAV
jgi:hypothetical protein